jgi:hypothetical protein
VIDDVAAAHHADEGEGAVGAGSILAKPLGQFAQHEAGDGGQIKGASVFQGKPGDFVQLA